MQGKKKKHPSCAGYIRRVLKQVNISTGISTRGMAVMDTLARNLETRLSTEAGQLARYKTARTMSAREIDTATGMLLPNDLAKHARAEGIKALNNMKKSHK